MVGTSNLGSWNGHWNSIYIYIYHDVYSIVLKIHVWKWHMSLNVSSISIHYILDNMSLKPLHRTFCFHAYMICFFWLVLEAPFRWMWMAPFITILEFTLAHWQESHRFHDFPWSDHDLHACVLPWCSVNVPWCSLHDFAHFFFIYGFWWVSIISMPSHMIFHGASSFHDLPWAYCRISDPFPILQVLSKSVLRNAQRLPGWPHEDTPHAAMTKRWWDPGWYGTGAVTSI